MTRAPLAPPPAPVADARPGRENTPAADAPTMPPAAPTSPPVRNERRESEGSLDMRDSLRGDAYAPAMKLTTAWLSRSWLVLLTGAVLPMTLTLAPGAQPRSQPRPADDLNAVLWLQRSAEYRAICRQTFAIATQKLDAALADEGRTAAVEQFGAQFRQLPPAVIVDVDETMLDNSPYNARLIEDRAGFDHTSWAAWVEERSAEPVPGALAFVRRATALGITVFYVTNRDNSLEAATLANLERCGFPASKDQLLMREEIDDDGSEKRNRRAHIAKSHRIAMLAGDDLGDFVPGARSASAEDRARICERYDSLFGDRWFVLPNPIYGSWTKSLGDDRRSALKTRR